MSQSNFNDEFYAPPDLFAAAAAADERSSFILKTYLYLVAAVCALVGIEVVIFNTLPVNAMAGMLTGGISWLIVLGLFIVVSNIANYWASNPTNSTLQLAGLGLYVVAEAFILAIPLSYAYLLPNGHEIVMTAAVATVGLFGLMSLVVFMTRADFSFLSSILWFGSIAAMAFIVVSIFFPVGMFSIFAYAMVALMCGYILYGTSNVLHHYRIGQHVAASLFLFSSLATLFWYVLQIFLLRGDD